MNMVLRTTGIMVIGLAVFGVLATGQVMSMPLLIMSFCTGVLGVSFFIIASLRERVLHLETYLHTSANQSIKDQKVVCKECGSAYGANQVRCPECGAE